MGYGSWWGLPGLGTCSCQATLAPGTWGHSARTQELPAAAGSGDALGKCKDVQSCCSSHGAAVPLPIKSLHVTMGGALWGPLCPFFAHQDSTVPKTGSSCPGSWQRPSTVALPHVQPCVTVSPSISSAMGKLWSPARQKCCCPQHGPGMAPDTEPSLCSSPAHGRAQRAPRCFLSASPAAAGEQEEEKESCSCPGLPWDPAAGLDTGITRLQPDHSQPQPYCSSSSVLPRSAPSPTALP